MPAHGLVLQQAHEQPTEETPLVASLHSKLLGPHVRIAPRDRFATAVSETTYDSLSDARSREESLLQSPPLPGDGLAVGWVGWKGDDPSQQPRLPGVAAYRTVQCMSFACSSVYLLYRALSMPHVAHLSWLVFTGEIALALFALCALITKWDYTDTNGTTPSLSELSAVVPRPYRMRIADWPTVGVLIATYSEDQACVEPTLDAALALDWPHDKLHIYVCDDGSEACRRKQDPAGSDWVAELCRDRHSRGGPAVTHLRRRKPQGYDHQAKAGNINNALGLWGTEEDWPGGEACLTPKGWTGMADRCEFTAIFDADMCAAPDFLQRTLPFFYNWDNATQRYEANRCAVVQTPQRFSNIPEGDPMNHAQIMDYECNMAAFDALGAVNMCGTGMILRTKALMGHAAPGQPADRGMAPKGLQYGSLTEDIHTSIALHIHGWTARYLREDLQTGLAPISLADTYDQRVRWITGGAQLVRLRFLKGDVAFEKSGMLSFRQKLSFQLWFGGLSGLVPFRLLMQLTPLFILFCHRKMYNFSRFPFLDEFAYACGPTAIILAVAGILLQPGRPPFWMLLRDTMSSVTYAPCELYGVYTMLTNKQLKFTVTSKDAGDDVNVGRYHPALHYHFLWMAIYAVLLVYSLFCLFSGVPTHSGHRPLIVYGYTAFFLCMWLAMYQAVMSAILVPLPARPRCGYRSYWTDKKPQRLPAVTLSSDSSDAEVPLV
eukprot:TRINITY_DN358_c0_g1_i1.p1 TRINITY_DN358_c0_g1~~TRINITY_DN358_c0_g1_i1.p1  ORF type:complete len:748 (+),score=204.32 TRINITY_DN358_c0_g1_i1:96-2246(+)